MYYRPKARFICGFDRNQEVFMKIGERIKQVRKEKNISVDTIAKWLGVSKTTIYRYEDSSIEKIPVNVFNKLCRLLKVTPAELLGNVQKSDAQKLPGEFTNAREAGEFLLRTDTLAAYGGYDPESMSEETIMSFANEILAQFELVSYKYKNMAPAEQAGEIPENEPGKSM